MNVFDLLSLLFLLRFTSNTSFHSLGGPCKAIAPLYKELSESYDNIVFLKVDVDENAETAMKYQVSAMPTFLFIKRGEIVDKIMGANPTKLKELLDELA